MCVCLTLHVYEAALGTIIIISNNILLRDDHHSPLPILSAIIVLIIIRHVPASSLSNNQHTIMNIFILTSSVTCVTHASPC